MKLLKKKIRNWLLSEDNPKEDIPDLIKCDDIKRPVKEPVLQFRIYNAENGQILEFSKYDHAKDRDYNSIYIINKDEEIADKVAKCLSLEMMK